ncbi:hypothetical protein [Microbacterium candidum]|uniref:DUF4232 domain-containing protein n=1 Tax=Microbacterium candidum TaxID=3041922 RepID=A0ABT7MV10_9MICO|nr:hypothetical protein [Microbacterium sp. ASV49]MDL9978296.1 hypothetical protein [Microbacterium sp. ASV49]
MTTQHPRRRHSPAVYRRRRLAVLLVLILIAAGVWLAIAQPWSSKAQTRNAPPPVAGSTGATSLPVPTGASPSDTPTPTVEADAQPTTVPPASTPTAHAMATAAPCTPANVAVDAVTDQTTYPSGQSPKFSIRLTNHGSTDCTMNVGTTTQKFTVTSGSDTWWRSTDCQSEPSDMTVLIKAGQTVQSATPIVWDRTRSSVSTCSATTRPKAPGGGASYHLAVEIGGIASNGTAQFILY